jgi:hypothetical protein
MFAVLSETSPGVFCLVGSYDAKTVGAALREAATERADLDVFYAVDMSTLTREQVAARRTVIDWQPSLGA